MNAGRFAPTPSGPLHFGSLVTALAAWCNARSQQIEFFIRIDDIDPPRIKPGAADHILHTLEQYGFDWDGEVRYQSTRTEAYRAALEKLISSGRAYRCRCSRRELHGIGIYPGTCWRNEPAAETETAWRFHIHAPVIEFDDPIQRHQRYRTGEDIGDTVIWRRDDLVAYALASALDDAEQASEVVRGADLLAASALQQELILALEGRVPRYAHVPVLTDSRGEKLSKQAAAIAIHNLPPMCTLQAAWQCLGQAPLDGEIRTPAEFLHSAAEHWHIAAVPARLEIATPSLDSRVPSQAH